MITVTTKKMSVFFSLAIILHGSSMMAMKYSGGDDQEVSGGLKKMNDEGYVAWAKNAITLSPETQIAILKHQPKVLVPVMMFGAGFGGFLLANETRFADNPKISSALIGAPAVIAGWATWKLANRYNPDAVFAQCKHERDELRKDAYFSDMLENDDKDRDAMTFFAKKIETAELSVVEEALCIVDGYTKRVRWIHDNEAWLRTIEYNSEKSASEKKSSEVSINTQETLNKLERIRSGLRTSNVVGASAWFKIAQGLESWRKQYIGMMGVFFAALAGGVGAHVYFSK